MTDSVTILGAINWCLWCHALNPHFPEDCRYCFEATSLPDEVSH